MSADLFDSILGLIQQATGNNNNSWGTTYNNSFASPNVQAIAGVNTITNTSGTADLSTVVPPAGKRLDLHKIQIANGALTADLTVQIVNISKTWLFWNLTSNAFNMFVKVPGGVARTGPNLPGGLVQIPQGACVGVMCDGAGNLIRLDDTSIGNFSLSGKSAPGPGELACNGASLLRAEWPDLFGKIGVIWGSADSVHFTLPLLTDTNRFLRAGGGSGPAVGTYQSNQNLAHTHAGATFSGTTGTESQDHTHTFSGTTATESVAHVHAGILTPAGLAASAGVQSSGNPQYGNTGSSGSESANHTHTFSGTTSTDSVTHTHTYSGTTGTIPSSGGSEARPESAAVLICIRY